MYILQCISVTAYFLGTDCYIVATPIVSCNIVSAQQLRETNRSKDVSQPDSTWGAEPRIHIFWHDYKLVSKKLMVHQECIWLSDLQKGQYYCIEEQFMNQFWNNREISDTFHPGHFVLFASLSSDIEIFCLTMICLTMTNCPCLIKTPGPLGTNFSEISIEIHTFSSRKRIWKCCLQNFVYFTSASMS